MANSASDSVASTAPTTLASAPYPVIMLRGSAALSPFRLERLLKRIQSEFPAVASVYAEYRHFAALDQSLAPAELDILERMRQRRRNFSSKPRAAICGHLASKARFRW